ncbi:hypothetical protein [Basilea psittacipulmonis]|uniref:Uncharacterized protein n=1 Tax=Basilea psittacipulmonis DSM 24701 TaxID=1072685 RepID=A0A077DIX9_9BURK|nr:hypothetical protein [Basilea psittacipulmonis]AIL33103.1 hypothetical protein IX83_07110 [Basilea psittacipulmonis DSM 24701]
MNLPSTIVVPSMTDEQIEKVHQVEEKLMELEQIEIPTHHVIHAGMYARTIKIPAGAIITGVLIKRSTLLIVQGTTTVYVGDKEIFVNGYQVLPASKHRKQMFMAHEDTYLTMIFPTQAKSVQEAEEEFTDQAHLLASRSSDLNTIVITGE